MSAIIKSETPGLLENDRDKTYVHTCTPIHQHDGMPQPPQPKQDSKELQVTKHTYTTTCTIQIGINMLYCLHYLSMYQHVLLFCTIQVYKYWYVIQLALYKSVLICSHHHMQTTHTVYFLRRDLSLPTWSSTATRTLQTRCGSFPACLIIMATLSVFMAMWAATLGLKSVKKWSPSVWWVPSTRPCTGVESSRPSTSTVHWKVTTARLAKEAPQWVSNVWRDGSTMFGHAVYTVRLPP